MPSIRGRGRHSLVVQKRKIVRVKGAKVFVPDGPPVLIKSCSVQSVREWSTSEEDLTNGIIQLSLRRVYSREWPGDENSLVYFNGGEYECVGDPQHMDQTRRTHHWLVTIRWLGQREAPTLPAPPEEESE